MTLTDSSNIEFHGNFENFKICIFTFVRKFGIKKPIKLKKDFSNSNYCKMNMKPLKFQLFREKIELDLFCSFLEYTKFGVLYQN